MAASKKAATVQSIISNTSFINCNAHTKNVFSQLQKCRTSALGYHIYKSARQKPHTFTKAHKTYRTEANLAKELQFPTHGSQSFKSGRQKQAPKPTHHPNKSMSIY